MAQFYGNEQIQHTLHQMLLRDRAPHGFLFYGETGLGKKTLAKQFLAELLCTGTEKPCGSCKSCKMLADGVHPDVRFVEHSGKRNGFSVDTVREVCVDLASPPNEGNAKCYVFGDCDAMDTRTQNLLLKAVEEPAGLWVFYFYGNFSGIAAAYGAFPYRVAGGVAGDGTGMPCCTGGTGLFAGRCRRSSGGVPWEHRAVLKFFGKYANS